MNCRSPRFSVKKSKKQMYEWRKLNNREKIELLEYRKANKKPWHTPPHTQGNKTYFLITAACYEHNR
ncbi:MAG: hypothetical protein DRI44_07770 [Chlamydiae bacterium]|nr:MAG: hypothetical protein DRI44_07770 [Chlamydiota bacterium]